MILKEDRDIDVDTLIAHVDSMNEQFPMYVLTNTYRSYGASCMLYDGLMRKLALRMNTDFYIIPSSVHELILIPVAEEITRDDLDDMIKSINSTEISKEEVLSDTSYIYTRENGFE